MKGILKYFMTQAIYILLNQKLKDMEEWRTHNTVFMLGMVLGTKVDNSCLGPDVIDASGIKHAGIGNTVLPVLAVKEIDMLNLYKLIKDREVDSEFEAIDFTLTAQNSHVYAEYSQKLSAEKIEEQIILGVALLGDQKALRSICGSLPRWK